MTSTEKERADYNIDRGGLERAANVLHEVAQMIRPPRDESPLWEGVEYTTKKTKTELLEHYATREPKPFVQIDGWLGGDDVIKSDDDGRGMSLGFTTELMEGADVRLLIKPDSDPTEIVALLHNAIKSIESMPDSIATSHWLHPKPHLVEPLDNNAEIERIRIKLDTALESTGYGWETSLGDLVGGELTDMLKDGRADDDIEWMRAAETKFDQYCR